MSHRKVEDMTRIYKSHHFCLAFISLPHTTPSQSHIPIKSNLAILLVCYTLTGHFITAIRANLTTPL